MKISRSKTIKIIFSLTLFVLVISSIFIFFNKKDSVYNYSYVFNSEKNVIEESINEEIKPIVYDNMTLEELSDKIDKSLNSDISGYGNFIVSYSLEKGVDPYLATAIMLHETGCTWECSNLVKSCNNVGGMKGSGCGDYGYFNSLEEGIQKFIDNIYNNYYLCGLTNAEMMGNKYAEDPEWSRKVNGHIEKIKNR